MRVGHLIPQYKTNTGTGLAVAGLCEAIAKAGSVEVIVYKAAAFNDEYYLNNVKIITFVPANNKLFNLPLTLVSRLKNNKDKLDLLQLHAPFTLSNLLMSRYVNIPYVYTPHGCFDPVSLNRKGKYLKKLVYSFLFEKRSIKNACSIMVATDEEMKDINNYSRSKYIDVVPYPVSIDYNKTGSANNFRKKFGFADNDFIVLFVGRWDIYNKGLDLMIEAAKILRNVSKAIKFAFIGYNSPNNIIPLEELISRNNVSDNCFALGPVYGEEKADAIAGSDIYCQPSRYESFGIALVEAMSLGSACIVSSGCKISKTINNKSAGMIINPDEKSLAEAIIDLHSNEGKRISLAENAKKWVKDELNPENIAKKSFGFYSASINNLRAQN